jgi:ABC-type multidrug transport system fused ATPase/permease subunit
MQSVPLSHWRRQIGYVPQETILFHQSIRDNLAWGNPAADDRAVETVARQALAHDFIMQQPAGYETVIGDQGARLSGGQRQRLGIARALLCRPLLLVMDEATSALDSASEAAVLETVDGLRRSICVVMVAHRLATVRSADLIVVLSQGRVVEIGPWPDLMAKQGVFFRLAQAQHLE